MVRTVCYQKIFESFIFELIIRLKFDSSTDLKRSTRLTHCLEFSTQNSELSLPLDRAECVLAYDISL